MPDRRALVSRMFRIAIPLLANVVIAAERASLALVVSQTGTLSAQAAAHTATTALARYAQSLAGMLVRSFRPNVRDGPATTALRDCRTVAHETKRAVRD
jgi:hypothetical protein